ncbi:MAG: L-iditol 2-dehydrogenase [Bacteroidota bacterium]|nr:L-iditol 2-dehydrogenase [Bacteroidota bacterium]
MKAMVLTDLQKIEIIKKPDPEIKNPDGVLVKMKSVGICGSDIHYYKDGRIGSQVVKYPFTLGHEGAGIVEKIGKDVKNVKPGDRIAIDPSMPCFSCDQCIAGRFHTCRNIRFLGCPDQAEGCMSEYIVIPSASCFRLGENISLVEAALSEPLSIGLYSTMLSVPLKNARVGILGSGPIGISVMLSSVHYGAGKVYMTDLLDERLSLAADMGADWTGNPEKEDIVSEILEKEANQLDTVFECCGKQEALDQAIRLLKPGGKLVIVGVPAFENWIIGTDEMRKKELCIQNVRRQNKSLKATLELISTGGISPDKMLTHSFRIDQISEAFKLVAGYKDGVMKAMINF